MRSSRQYKYTGSAAYYINSPDRVSRYPAVFQHPFCRCGPRDHVGQFFIAQRTFIGQIEGYHKMSFHFAAALSIPPSSSRDIRSRRQSSPDFLLLRLKLDRQLRHDRYQFVRTLLQGAQLQTFCREQP
jgi:hypothetical protein